MLTMDAAGGLFNDVSRTMLPLRSERAGWRQATRIDVPLDLAQENRCVLGKPSDSSAIHSRFIASVHNGIHGRNLACDCKENRKLQFRISCRVGQ